MKPFVLEDKIVLVTGASSGIGRELARCFAHEKARLILSALPSESEALEALALELKQKSGMEVACVPCDLSEPDGPETLYNKVLEKTTHIDILVNNAGIIGFGSFHQAPLDVHENIIAVNLRAYMVLMRLFLPHMVGRGSGHVFNVGSMSAFFPSPKLAVYGAGKMFMHSLADAVREELKGTGVSVFTLDSGFTDTPMLNMEGTGHAIRSWMMGGFASPETVAGRGVEAFKKGKRMCIPDAGQWFLVAVLSRFAPRWMIPRISSFMIKKI